MTLSGVTHLYEALSYVWGSGAKDEHSIYIDEHIRNGQAGNSAQRGNLLITTNLYAALLHL